MACSVKTARYSPDSGLTGELQQIGKGRLPGYGRVHVYLDGVRQQIDQLRDAM